MLKDSLRQSCNDFLTRTPSLDYGPRRALVCWSQHQTRDWSLKFRRVLCLQKLLCVSTACTWLVCSMLRERSVLYHVIILFCFCPLQRAAGRPSTILGEHGRLGTPAPVMRTAPWSLNSGSFRSQESSGPQERITTPSSVGMPPAPRRLPSWGPQAQSWQVTPQTNRDASGGGRSFQQIGDWKPGLFVVPGLLPWLLIVRRYHLIAKLIPCRYPLRQQGFWISGELLKSEIRRSWYEVLDMHSL